MSNQLPKGWKEGKLGNHSVILRGSTITKSKVTHGEYPVVAGGREAAYYHNAYNREAPIITVSGSGASAGYVNFWETPIFASDCSTIAEKNVNIKYLYYFLKSKQKEILDKQVGVAIPHVSPKDIIPLVLIYPEDKYEQKYIVDTLDTMAEAIRLRKDTIEKTKELIPAIFQEMFGTMLGQDKISKHVLVNPAKAVVDQENEITFLAMADVSNDGSIIQTQTRLYKDVSNGFTSFINDDIIWAKITPCFENGKGTIVKDLINSVGFGSTEFYVLRCDKKYILPETLFYLLRSDAFMLRGKDNMKGAAGQKRLDKKFLENFYIEYPSLSLQQEFARKVEEINIYLEAQKAELKKQEDLFACLLQDAFSGKLTRN